MPSVTIVDYGLGNLFSVLRACEHVGLHARISSTSREICDASAVILPGVGAFGDAMEALKRRDLIQPLLDAAGEGKPFLGICLGMQLLLSESHEFGVHPGLGLISGRVVRLLDRKADLQMCKIPQVGWNRIRRGDRASWDGSLLENIKDGEFMYFIHSFCVAPEDSGIVLSTSQYGVNRFCSSLRRGNIYGFQFHPEKSGSAGLEIYRNFAALVSKSMHDQHREEIVR